MTKRAVNLFSGAGGTSLGLEQAGYEVMGYEKWDDAVETHRMNRMRCEQVDLKDEKVVERIVQAVHIDDVDCVWGSPPCQPFSRANDQQKMGRLDPRDCVPDYLKIVVRAKPRLTVMENVVGLVGKKNEEYLDWIIGTLTKAGYKVRYKVLNAADYGVPQARKRLIVVGRLDRLPKWPAVSEFAPTTMAEALGWNEDGTIDRRAGVRWLDQRNDQSNSGEGDPLWPLHRPATTIAGRCLVPDPGANANRFNGKKKSRNDGYVVTLGELAALQGFPQGFHFLGTKKSQALQIGNAVPPALAREVVVTNQALS